MKNQEFFETFYEYAILPKYATSLNLTDIKWIDHSMLDDSLVLAHYFESNGKQYILLSNDYSGGSYLDDGLSHEIIMYGDKTGFRLYFDDNKEIDNITGYYTLYREKVLS